MLKTVVRGRAPAAVVAGKAPVVPRAHLTEAAQRNPVVSALEELEAVAGTPVAVVAAAVGSVVEVVERMTTLAALMPEVEEVALHMQTRR